MPAAQVCHTDTDVQAAMAGWASWMPGMPAPILPHRPSPLAAAWARASPRNLSPSAHSAAEPPASQPTARVQLLPAEDVQPAAHAVTDASAAPDTSLQQSAPLQQDSNEVDPAAQPASSTATATAAPGGSVDGTAFSQMMQAARAKPALQTSGHQHRCTGLCSQCLGSS